MQKSDDNVAKVVSQISLGNSVIFHWVDVIAEAATARLYPDDDRRQAISAKQLHQDMAQAIHARTLPAPGQGHRRRPKAAWPGRPPNCAHCWVWRNERRRAHPQHGQVTSWHGLRAHLVCHDRNRRAARLHLRSRLRLASDTALARHCSWRQLLIIDGAVHSVCDPTVCSESVRDDEKLYYKSYRLMREFFSETS